MMKESKGVIAEKKTKRWKLMKEVCSERSCYKKELQMTGLLKQQWSERQVGR